MKMAKEIYMPQRAANIENSTVEQSQARTSGNDVK